MDDDEGVVFGHKQRAFLQSLLSRQTITFETARPIIATIETASNPERPTLEHDVTDADFETYIQAIGDAISPFDYEIRSSQHQITKERIYALVNTTSDALTQMATIHSADEIAFVKRVLDVMFDENNTQRAEIMAIKRNHACKLHRPPRDREEQSQHSQNAGLTMSQAERLMDNLVSEGWFEYNEETAYYSLSQRALMELRTWLVDAYNEEVEDDEEEEEPHQKIKFCAACKDIVTVGQRCPSLPCGVRLHEHCIPKLFRAQKGREQCSSCQTAWMDAPFVGERAASGGGQQGGSARRRGRNSAAGASRRSTSAAPTTNGHDVESDDADDGAELYE